jgi:phosphoglycerate dehydrogenase-like enzyme
VFQNARELVDTKSQSHNQYRENRMPTALIQGRIAVQFQHLLRKELDDSWKIHVWDPAINDPEEFVAMAYEADAIIGGKIPTDSWPQIPNLKLFQIPWTGYDFCSPESMPQGIPVCNCYEHERPIAEFVLCAILESKIGLREIDQRFRREGWGGRQPGTTLYHGEIRAQTVGIIGYGHIGEAVAKRAAAFDMRVVGIRRSKQLTPPLLDWLGTSDRMNDLLRESDFVVVACDLNEETEGMIGAPQLAMMKPDSVIINVARGRIIAEEPLYNALKNKEIGGAILDTWYNYIGPDKQDVWPSNYPFQDLDNVILSAHESASTSEQVERRWKFVASNLNRMIKGEPAENQVFKGTSKAGA